MMIRKKPGATGHGYSRTTSTLASDGTRLPRKIPAALVPTFPVLDWHSLFSALRGGRVGASTKSNPLHFFTRNGREALLLALQDIGLRPGDKVLLPAFHCEVMVAPIAQLGGKPVFYDIDDSLQPNFAQIRSLIDDSTRALLFAHFFGIPCRSDKFVALARQRGISLIEDCAHVSWNAKEHHGLGQTGDYALYSLRKFAPTDEGGLLVSDEPVADANVLATSNVGKARKIVGYCERAGNYGRLGVIGWLIKNLLRLRGLLRRIVQKAEIDKAETGEVDGFSEIISPVALNSVDFDIIVDKSAGSEAKRRRRNFELLAELLADRDGCRPLISNLPDGAVPFMVPVIVDHLDDLFPAMEDAALPMQRFGQFLSPDIVDAQCPTSILFSKKLVQFPCHPDLRDSEIAWIAQEFLKIVEGRTIL